MTLSQPRDVALPNQSYRNYKKLIQDTIKSHTKEISVSLQHKTDAIELPNAIPASLPSFNSNPVGGNTKLNSQSNAGAQDGDSASGLSKEEK